MQFPVKSEKMCFSAIASFSAGTVITGIGLVSLSKVRKPKQLLFAAIPLFFGAQQLIEGIVWLLVPHPEYLSYQRLAADLYLVFAHALWPSLIPISILLMEENEKKIKLFRILSAVGIVLSVFYISCLFIFPVNPQINCYHMLYVSAFPLATSNFALLFYLATTFAPLFMSSYKRTKLMGSLMAFSCIITMIFYTQFLTSVWCFFAALISVVVIWILKEPLKSEIAIN